MHLRRLHLALLSSLLLVGLPASAQSPAAETWRFDNLHSIGGHPVEVLGHPQVIESPYGKAVEFDGKGDGLFLPVHPLAGASAYTWEIIFRPDSDGPAAQRFFHLQEQDPATGKDTPNRLLTEIRIVQGKWCLDSHGSSGDHHTTLLNCDAQHLYPADQWYRVTTVFDGKIMRNYIGSVEQGEGAFALAPMRGGRTAVGIRINKVYPFKGAVLMARMTPRALDPSEFLQMPAKKTGTRD